MNRADRKVFEQTSDHLQGCWKRLVVTDVVYKMLAFALLAPLVSLVFRVLIAASGSAVLADEDLVYFCLQPLGWICVTITGGVVVGAAAMELSALMTVVVAYQQRKSVLLTSAIWFTIQRVFLILRLTGRIVAMAIATAAPFLAVAAYLYGALLTEFDINFYLAERPPRFWVAVVLGGADGIAMIALLSYLFVGWIFALPLLLFHDLTPAQALKMSRAATSGQRLPLALWVIIAWVTGVALSSLGNGLVLWIGRAIVPHANGSLTVVTLVVGGLLVLWMAVNFAVTLACTVTFAALLVSLCYRRPLSRDLSLPAAYLSEPVGIAPGLRFTRKRIVVAVGVLMGMAMIGGAVVVRSVRFEDQTVVTAHRGSSAAAPENTLAAVRQAIQDGADWVEIDVQTTADGTVVVAHDGDLKRIGGVNLRIREASANEVRQVDVGSWFGTKFHDERIPTLDELLEMCKGKIRVNIELKYYGPSDRLEERVVELVEAHQMEDDIAVMSMKRDGVARMHALRPQWEVGLLTAVAFGDLAKTDADFLAVNTDLATRDFVRHAHRHGKRVHVWTVNDAVTMSIMMSRDVDNIITDHPMLARSVLQQRTAMSSAERLLIEAASLLGAERDIKNALSDS